MKAFLTALAFSALSLAGLGAGYAREHVDMPSSRTVSKAAFDCIKPAKAGGVLVLVPGYNEDGSGFLGERAWTRFATERNWAVVGVTFVSPVEELKRNGGYYDVAAGSGLTLLRALKKLGLLGKPLYIYGFSGGARFAARFADVYSKYVRAFAAHALGEIPECEYQDGPRGIVSCGEDDPRVGEALSWFKDARAAGWRLSWIEAPDLGHARSATVEEFVRQWFLDESRSPGVKGVECELGSGNVVRDGAAGAPECSWFPSARVCDLWRSGFGPRDVRADRPEAGSRSRRSGAKTSDGEVFCREVQTNVEECPKLTLYGRIPASNRVKGVICLSLIANDVGDVRALLKGENREGVAGEWLRYAEKNDLAVLAWGAPGGLWRTQDNWDEIDRKENLGLGRTFNTVAVAWKAAVEGLAREHGFPGSRFLMVGFSRGAQFAQRLALHVPAKFAAVAVHVPSSFDHPVAAGKEIVWCLTTGENECGYERSLKYVAAAKKNGYPIVYKAYPGLGHRDSMLACELGQAVFDFVLKRGTAARDSSKWEFAADYVNQRTARRAEDSGMVPEYTVLLPDPEVEEAWKKE